VRSHFLISQGVATTCAVAGAVTILGGHCSAQQLVAADYATNSTYAADWTAGQNGGHGFGRWSFDRTDATPLTNSVGVPYKYQGMSSSSALGTAWTLLTHNPTNGLANAGRAISEPGGLQPGQTFETVIQNPVAYYYYRGYDILLYNGTNNLVGGDNTAALRMDVFSYIVTTWHIIDGDGSTFVPLDPATTAVAGMKFDLTLLTTNTYSLTLTTLGNSSTNYTHTGTLGGSLPINWANYRLWNGPSDGPEDTNNNFEISSMTISAIPGLILNIQKAGTNVILSWPTNFTNFSLFSTTNLGPPVWTPASTNHSGVVNGQNVVTNPIAGRQRYYRLQQ
jgi:hypothetical protein